MTFKTVAVALVALSLIGCKDVIEVPNEENNNITGDGTIVYNTFDIDTDPDQFGEVDIIDSTGKRIKSVGLSLAWGSLSSGKNAIVLAEPRSQPEQVDIIVTDNNGDNRRTIASVDDPGQRISSSPVISRNGSHVAFITSDSLSPTVRGYRLHVVGTDGSSPDRIISERVVRETIPGFSPDGSQIAFFDVNRLDDKVQELVVASTNGSGSTVIVPDLNVAGDLSSSISWGSNNRIAFGVVKGGDLQLFIVNPDGSQLIQLGEGVFPTWSDDGQKLAWVIVSQDKTNAEIAYTSDLGITIDTLTTTANHESHPQFSPDGKKILCTIWVGDLGESRGRLKLIDLETRSSITLAEPAYTGTWLRQ